MHKKEFKRFLGKHVAVGVPHRSEDRPFFFFGRLINVTDDAVLLERKFKLYKIEGLKQIPMDLIIDIHISEPRGVHKVD